MTATAATTATAVPTVARPVVVVPAWSTRVRRLARLAGVLGLAGIVADVVLGLWVTPPDKVQGNAVRLLYIHPPIAWVALYLALGAAGLSALLWLWPRTRSPFWDQLGAASMEVGILFTGLTLVTGSIWGRATWGVWWAWDARLTLTALLFVMQLGYLALRWIPASAAARARRCAIATIVIVADVPIDHFSVQWWNTLHQGPTVLNATLTPDVGGSMAVTLLIGFLAFTLLFVWMLAVRYRVQVLKDAIDEHAFELALRERWAEGEVG